MLVLWQIIFDALDVNQDGPVIRERMSNDVVPDVGAIQNDASLGKSQVPTASVEEMGYFPCYE